MTFPRHLTRRSTCVITAIIMVLAMIIIPRHAHAEPLPNETTVTESTVPSLVDNPLKFNASTITSGYAVGYKRADGSINWIPNGLGFMYAADPQGNPITDDIVEFYCIDADTLLLPEANNTAVPITDVNKISGDNGGKIRWVISHGYSQRRATLSSLRRATGISDLTDKEAMTATQAAVWHFSNGYTPTGFYTDQYTAERIATAYNYLTRNATVEKPVSYHLGINPARTGGLNGQNIGPFVVKTTATETTARLARDGKKLPDGVMLVNKTTGDKAPAGTELSVTNGDELFVAVPQDAAPSRARIIVTGRADVPRGTALAAMNINSQSVVTVHDSAPLKQSVQARAVWWKAPTLQTTATDAADGDHTVTANDNATINDEVRYTGLVPGKTYTISGELVIKATGKRTGIVASTTFTPQRAFGKENVRFTVGRKLAGKTVVVYERLYAGATATGDEIARHEDIKDDGQTVTIELPPVAPKPTPTPTTTPTKPVVPTTPKKPVVPTTPNKPVVPTTPEKPVVPTTPNKPATPTTTKPSKPEPRVITLATSAEDQADHDKTISKDGGKVVDHVTYTGLVSGQTYTVAGELMDKSTEKATGVTASTTFVAQAEQGVIDVAFDVPGSLAGNTLVVFEKLYEGTVASGSPVAVHDNLNDPAQTVSVERPHDEVIVPPSSGGGEASERIAKTGSTGELEIGKFWPIPVIAAIIGGGMLLQSQAGVVASGSAAPVATEAAVKVPERPVSNGPTMLAVTGADVDSLALAGVVFLVCAGVIFAARRRRQG